MQLSGFVRLAGDLPPQRVGRSLFAYCSEKTSRFLSYLHIYFELSHIAFS